MTDAVTTCHHPRNVRNVRDVRDVRSVRNTTSAARPHRPGNGELDNRSGRIMQLLSLPGSARAEPPQAPAIDRAPAEGRNDLCAEMNAIRAVLLAVVALLLAQRDDERSRDVALNLLGGAAGEGSTPARGEHNQLPEALSEREMQILRYLPTHLSASDIANELFISLNTAKTHVRHIYTKLGVNSRKDAVERARLVRLLAP
jgi:LuxR family transcriptional regulator, maltose regulon positive regulatory protein